MLDDDNYTDIDVSDVVDDTEEYADTDNINNENHQNSETIDEINIIPNSELVNSEDQASYEKKNLIQNNKSEVVRNTRLPVARIKHIMKMDPDVNIVSAEAVFLVTRATELFLETIAKEAFSVNKKKKTVTKKDLDYVINTVDCLCFLEGAMDF